MLATKEVLPSIACGHRPDRAYICNARIIQLSITGPMRLSGMSCDDHESKDGLQLLLALESFHLGLHDPRICAATRIRIRPAGD